MHAYTHTDTQRTRLCIGATTGSRSSLARILLPDTVVKKLPRRVLEKLQPPSFASDSAPDDATDSSSVSENSSSLSSTSYAHTQQQQRVVQ